MNEKSIPYKRLSLVLGVMLLGLLYVSINHFWIGEKGEEASVLRAYAR
jgi:hypothetical protein